MSNNATRLGHGLGFKAQSTGVDYLLSRAISADAEQRLAGADLLAQEQEQRLALRNGKGVAWVHGVDYAPLNTRGGGMTTHLGQCPVITLKGTLSRVRVQVTTVNHRLTVVSSHDYW